jgi:hypothetical protein
VNDENLQSTHMFIPDWVFIFVDLSNTNDSRLYWHSYLIRIVCIHHDPFFDSADQFAPCFRVARLAQCCCASCTPYHGMAAPSIIAQPCRHGVGVCAPLTAGPDPDCGTPFGFARATAEQPCHYGAHATPAFVDAAHARHDQPAQSSAQAGTPASKHLHHLNQANHRPAHTRQACANATHQRQPPGHT